MLDGNDVYGVRDAARRGHAADTLFGEVSSAPLLFQGWRADQLGLHDVARTLAGNASHPSPHRLVEALTLPPVGVTPGQVDGCLSSARLRLTEAVSTQKQALSVLCACVVKLSLLLVRAVVFETVLRLPLG